MRLVNRMVTTQSIRAAANSVQTALDKLTAAVNASNKPDAEITEILEMARAVIEKPAPKPVPAKPEPTTPEARAAEIRRIVGMVGLPGYVADYYVSTHRSATAVKSELLAFLPGMR